jgi:hypothetical protein
MFFDESKLLFNESKLFCSFNESLKLQSVIQSYCSFVFGKIETTENSSGPKIRKKLNKLV